MYLKIQYINLCVSHSVRPVGRGLSVTVTVLWSAQRLPFRSLVKGDHRLHCTICKKNELKMLYTSSNNLSKHFMSFLD